MENRLTFFAATAEQQENAEASQTEKTPDGLQKTAEELAQLEKLKAKPGGTKAKLEAHSLIDNSDLSDFAKKLLQKKITTVETAANNRKQNLTPQNTEILDKAVAALKKSVEFQKKRLAENAAVNSKFERFKSLTNADELFRDVKVSMKSETKGGKFDITWKEFNSLEKFKKLGLEQKEAFIKALNEKITDKNPEGAKAINGILQKFENNAKLPKKWREYAKDPEKWGHTREHAAKWLQENADKKILHAETVFKFLEGNHHLLEKAGIAMPSHGEVFDKSTSEFNQYFDGLKQKIAKVDTETAAQMDALKVSEGAEIETTQIEMKTSGAEKEKAESEKFNELAKKIQESSSRKSLMEKLDAKKKEARKDTSSDEANRAASLRSGETRRQPNFFKRALSKFGGEKKEESGEKEDVQIHERAGKAVVDDLIGPESEAADRNESLKLTESQRKEIAEMFGFKELPKGREWENPLGVLMMKDADAKSVEDATKKNRDWWRGKTELFG